MNEFRAEIEDVRGEIESLASELVSLREERRSRMDDLRAARGALRRAQADGRRLATRLQRMQTDLWLLPAGPAWASAGIAHINAASSSGRAFLSTLLARLEAADRDALATDSAVDRCVEWFEPPRGKASFEVLGAPQGIGAEMRPRFTPASPTVSVFDARCVVVSGAGVMVSRPHSMQIPTPNVHRTHPYAVDGQWREVPWYSYTLSAEQWGSDGRTAEMFAVYTTVAFLAAEGRRAILVLGGPGRPDILSLDATGRLISIEVKGTFSGTPLDQAGIMRDLRDPLTGQLRLYENSPEWHRRNGPAVLRALETATINLTGDALAEIRELSIRYAHAMREQFRAHALGTEIFQVGEREEIPWVEANAMLQSFLAATRPERIVQIDVKDPGDL